MSQTILQNGYAILLANTSDIDKHLLNQELLLRRIADIKKKKEVALEENIQKRLQEIERVNQYLLGDLTQDQYNDAIDYKDQLNYQLKQLRESSIFPTYEDVRATHAFFINRSFKPMVSVAYGYSITTVTPIPLLGSSFKFKVPVNGDFLADQALHITLSELSTQNIRNKARWFDFIGHRLIKEVRLVMDGLVLDRYGTEEMEMYYRFHVSKDQKAGWKRCVGQEVERVAFLLQDPEKQSVREKKMLCDGYQTPKQVHEPLDLYIPLLFWFNTDPAFALSNWNITFDKLFIEIDLAPLEDCISVIQYVNDGGLINPIKVEQCELISNHVYVQPEIAELFKHKTQFSIVRVHKRIEKILNKNEDTIRLNDIKHAVENMYIRFRPRANELDENRSELWRRNDIGEYKELKYPSIINVSGTTTLAYTSAYYYTNYPAVEYIALTYDSNTIYDAFAGTFYNSYIPLRYGGERIMTPDDEGAYLLTFSLYPGDPQPSGYLNFSKSNENYLHYASSYINNDNTVDMSICTTAINFLVLLDGALSLRYMN